MEAVILVGGMGTRLRPLTLSTPKPMLPAAGVPFLTHQLARLAAAGVDHVVLATSYRPEVFAAHFGDGTGVGLRLDYVTETEPLGTGGGIRNVADRLESGPAEPVVVLNGDVLSGHDIRAQVDRHAAGNAAVTLHLVEVADPRAFGCVPVDEAGRVTAFLEKTPDPVTNRINAGCYVFARRVVDAIPAGRPVSVERETFPELLRDGATVLGYLDSSYWLDVGTPAAFVQGSADLVRGIAPSPAVVAPAPSLVAPDAEVAPDAVVVGGSAIGARARVAAGARVEGSVVMAGAEVGPGASVLRSVVGRDAVIGAATLVTDAVVGEGVRVGARNELLAGVRLWPGVDLPDGGLRFSSDA